MGCLRRHAQWRWRGELGRLLSYVFLLDDWRSSSWRRRRRLLLLLLLLWVWVVILRFLHSSSSRLMRRYVCQHHEQSSMLVRNDLRLLWFWLWRRRPLDFDRSIRKAVHVVTSESFCAVWTIELGKATCNILNGVVGIVVFLNKSNPCHGQLSSHSFILEFPVSLHVGPTAGGEFGANAVIIVVMGFIAVGGWENIVFVIRRISVLALHLPLKLFCAKVYLQHKVIL